MKILSLAACLIFCTTATLCAQQCVLGPPFFDGRAMRELAANPDMWKTCREKTDMLLFADHTIQRHFKDDAELAGIFQAFREMEMPIQLEVGAVKEWGHTGEACFRKQTPAWERFLRLGAKISGVAMDEPLAAAVRLEKDMEYAAEETADFIARVRKAYPDWHVTDIEAFPAATADELIRWIDLLDAKLKEREIRRLDAFRLDVDWMHFVRGTGRGCWRDVIRIENHCRSKNIRFSMIFWAANYPAMAREGLADESTWYVGTLQMASDYAINGGWPDEIVVQSWVSAPAAILPETGEFTFTRSALDVFRKNAK